MLSMHRTNRIDIANNSFLVSGPYIFVNERATHIKRHQSLSLEHNLQEGGAADKQRHQQSRHRAIFLIISGNRPAVRALFHSSYHVH